MMDISKDMADSFFKSKQFAIGKILIFKNDEGLETHFKIVRFDRKRKICKVEPAKIYTEDEINAMSRADAVEIISGRND